MGSDESGLTKIVVWLGASMVIAGLCVLTGYSLYYFVRAFFGPDVPLLVQIAVSGRGLGDSCLAGRGDCGAR